jgi:diketogulonate reductase-like aldo/keto reductase
VSSTPDVARDPGIDVVDPATVPVRVLAGGDRMPAVGMGTFGSDRYGTAQVAEAVRGALEAGYRLVDCASVYGNEADIGQVLVDAFRDRVVPRDELFVMSKLWNDSHGAEGVASSVRRTLTDLGLDHLDGYFVHWPFPNHHPPGADPDARDPHARPYLHDEFMETWQAMELLVDQGLVRHLGTSNVTVPKLRLILGDARVRPSLNEMELHPCFQQPELFDFCVAEGVQPVGYSPLGSPSRPERDRTPGDQVDIEHPAVVAAARAHGVHPALVCLKWAVQRGQVPIPFAVKRSQYVSNLRAVTTDPLTAQEMAALREADQGDRLIKGQVFLWPGSASWEDLWDVDGRVTTGVDFAPRTATAR